MMGRYLRNCWYMVGWSDEIGEGVLSRRIGGERIAFYRTGSGAVAALHDRCPHRCG